MIGADGRQTLPVEIARWNDQRRERRSDFDRRQRGARPMKNRRKFLPDEPAIGNRLVPAHAPHGIVRLARGISTELPRRRSGSARRIFQLRKVIR